MNILIQGFVIVLTSICGEALQFSINNKSSLCENETRYYKWGGACCQRCPPGQFAAKRCDSELDTVCRPCSNGTFNQHWNYARNCRLCQPCELDMGLIVQEDCSPTRDTLCVCPPGSVCHNQELNGKCRYCVPDPTVPPGSIPRVEGSTRMPQGSIPMPQGSTSMPRNISSGDSLWIITLSIVIPLVIVVMALLILAKMPLWNNIGGVFRIKELSARPPLDQIGQGQLLLTPPLHKTTDTPQRREVTPPGAYNSLQGNVIDSFYPGTSQQVTQPNVNSPLQEEGNDLRFPIQETQPPQCDEFTQCVP